MQLVSGHALGVLIAVTILSTAGVQAQPGEDCNNDGIPDDVLGLGRLFRDTFLQPRLDSSKWAVVSGATVDNVGINEPTEPYSLRLDGFCTGGDSVESVAIDLSNATDAVLTYSWQRTGGGEQPDAGDDLFIEFSDAAGTWIILAQHPGDGPAMTTYEEQSIALPPEAYHANFVLRIRNLATTGYFDDWFVDDIFITDGVPDCNHNGIPDDCDIMDGTSLDCNANGIPDECDLDEGISADCNDNNVPDECDIVDGTSIDSNGDHIPDECQDCNGNGVLDPNDIANGTSEDCNANGVPDECDLADGTSEDCNGDGVPDDCEMAPRTYQVDDGRHETLIGAAGGGDFIWLNQFTVQPGGEEIAALALTWGRVPVGLPTTIAIWTDPDDDGDPTNAILVQTVGPVPVANPETDVFTVVPVPLTYVGEIGDVFFVGAHLTHEPGQNPAPLDQDSPSHERSWLAIGDNLADLSANPTPPTLIDRLGFPGNWLLRCQSPPEDCNANGVLDECDIAAGASHDNNLSSIPDECELGSATDVTLVPDANCYNVNDTVTIEIWMNYAVEVIVGGQFSLQYDDTKLHLVSVEPASAPSPFTDEIYECSIVAGEPLPQCNATAGLIDYAVGVPPSTPGTTGSAQMVVITFTAAEQICAEQDLVTWWSDGLPIRLGTADSTSVYPLLVNLDVIDDTPPTLSVPPDIGVAVEAESCAATLDPGFATATDDCTAAADIIISWVRSDAKPSLTDPYEVADSPITITWQAEDGCGNVSTDVTTITVVLWGDLDYDSDIDLADLAQLLSNYGVTAGASYEDGDLDYDEDVDLSDLAALLAAYGTTCR
ncbi:MAG: cohesin domain-containing protein [Phycisphaerae bacterium]